ncbi:MAG: chromosomal replication initiator protein DnaA [Planctomycetota bacterium]|nr:chromosomal replication initiator protein DnaA [Planctomycetota bacterium]
MAPLQDSQIGSLVTNLRESVGTERWRVWFEGATDFHVTEDGVTVGVANLFIGDHLQRHFADHIEAAARQSVGRNLPITYRVKPDLFQRRRRENLEGEAEAMQRLGQSPQGSARRDERPDPASARPARQPARSRPLFTLKNFVVGPCNRMAHAAALAAVAAPGKDFHPLFIQAGCGLGKTHLLQAILNAYAPRHEMRVACVSAEQFTNQYLTGMRTRRLDAFRHRYRSLDVLAIDDVHFLAGKAATQEEFLHTFNELDGQGRLVVLASDSHPRDLAQIQNRLISRWVAGLVVRMTPPGRDTRRRILEAKAILMGRPLASDVLDLLADRLGGSVRDLEGGLTRLIAFAALLKTPITPDLARRVAADLATAPPKRTGLEEIEQAACAFFGVAPADVRSRRKARPISLARQATMVLARELTDLSLSEIARGLGSKHHTTVLAACRKWQQLVANGTEVTWTDRDQRRTMSAEALLAHLRQQIQA